MAEDILGQYFGDTEMSYAPTVPFIIQNSDKNLLTNDSVPLGATTLDSNLFKKEIDNKRANWLRYDKYGIGKVDAYGNGIDADDGDDLQIWMHQQITTKYKDFNPHVSGFYYIHMVPGTWVDQLSELSKHRDKIREFGEFSSGIEEVTEAVLKNFGQYATDIDIPQLNMEYEVISGKSRSLNYATRANYTGDFTINFIEDYNLNVFRYNELWFKYIEALRKGYITNPGPLAPDSEMFMNIPYFNAVWVAIFKPFSTKIQGLIKIMGVSPVSLPFKQVVGDRAKNTLTTINITYKSTDMIHKFYESFNGDQKESSFYNEFIADIKKSKRLSD